MNLRFELTVVEADPPPASRCARVHGEVDSDNVSAFTHSVESLFADGAVVLDLSEISFFDSAGFSALETLARRGRVAVVLSRASTLRGAADVVGLRYHDGVDAARAALDGA